MTAQERLQSIVRDLELIEDCELRKLLAEDFNAFDKLQDLINDAKYEAEEQIDELLRKEKESSG